VGFFIYTHLCIPHPHDYSTPMIDLFSDPILFIPVIAILVIFGAFYVTAMIWSYNRDAKKQGEKSGCLPIIIMAFMLLTFVASLTH